MREPEAPSSQTEPVPSAEPMIVILAPRRVSLKFVPPLLIVLIAAGLLVYRFQLSDFQGVRLPQWERSKGSNAPETGAREQLQGTRETASAATAPKDDTRAWDDIEREAERKRAEIAELERVKEAADKKAESQPPRIAARPGQIHRPLAPQELQRLVEAQHQIHRRHLEEFARMQQAMLDRHRAMINRFENDFGRFPGLPREPMGRFRNHDIPGAIGGVTSDGQFMMRWEVHVNGQKVDGGTTDRPFEHDGRNRRRALRGDRPRLGF